MTDDASTTFEVDIALSFAGENRAYVADVAERLRGQGIRVFYDQYEQATLWGKTYMIASTTFIDVLLAIASC